MEMVKRTKAINGEIQLPEAIIQHIQSYLSWKQGAQTSVLSKSWYNAWSTRQDLDFRPEHFWEDGNWKPWSEVLDEFSSFVKRTMQRYEDLDLKIVSLRLSMRITGNNWASLADETIKKALKMGVRDLDLQFMHYKYILPSAVFESESLVRLSANWCAVDPIVDRKVLCSRLKYLCLKEVYIRGDTLRHISFCCPLIENLALCNCVQLDEVKGSRKATEKFTFWNPLIGHENQNIGSVAGSPIKVYVFRNLNYLSLNGVHLDSLLFDGFSLKFPCLEDLMICNCSYGSEINISSHSLKRISLEDCTRMLQAKFEVPNIHKFSFYGSRIPSVSFTPVSREWESDISIDGYLRESWLLELSIFLSKLSQSKISLSLPYFMKAQMVRHINYYIKGARRLPKPVVGNLILSTDSSSVEYPALLNGLVLSCCPKIITVTWSPCELTIEEGNDKLVETFEKLIQQVGKSFRILRQNRSRLCDLDKVNVEFADETFKKWQSMPLKTWLATPQTTEYRGKLRLQSRLLNA